MTCPEQSTDSAAGKRSFISAESPTAAISSPSVTTVAFHSTRFLSPRVTTIPFSKRVGMVYLLILSQDRQFLCGAGAHIDSSSETFLGTNRATDAKGRIGDRETILVQCDRHVRTAGTIAA